MKTSSQTDGLMIYSRICGNSAYVLGSTVETEQGLKKFLAVFTNTKTVDIINIFGQLLTHADGDCVLNATGTLGTIVCRFATVILSKQSHHSLLGKIQIISLFVFQCGSKEGRDLLLKHFSVSQIILTASSLLNSTNSWIASNAALVLAR